MAHFTGEETKSAGKDEPHPRLGSVNGGASSVTQQIDAQGEQNSKSQKVETLPGD